MHFFSFFLLFLKEKTGHTNLMSVASSLGSLAGCNNVVNFVKKKKKKNFFNDNFFFFLILCDFV